MASHGFHDDDRTGLRAKGLLKSSRQGIDACETAVTHGPHADIGGTAGTGMVPLPCY